MYRLIIADDEENIRLGIRDCICWENLGLEVAGTASNGKEALELIRQIKPDVAIMDVNMPDMTGLEVIDAVREERISDTSFLILSGYDQFSYVQQALKLRVVDYLLKPCSPTEIQNVVSETLRRRANTRVLTNFFREQSDSDMEFIQMEPNFLDDADLVNDRSPENKSKNSTMSAAVDYIRTHYAEALSLDVVSEVAGVSPAYLSSLFRQELDISFVDYVNKTRVQAAKKLMDAGSCRNADVAYRVGFTSEKYFSRVFKKYAGVTASDYRHGQR
ncbi:MAG: response regulator [Eubacteriales bacterium]|nr:response regulator [Eubacteriales bacterium]